MASFAIPLLTAGISGLAGLFGGRKQTATQDSTTNSNQSGSFSNEGMQSGQSASIHNLSPFQQQLAQLFTRGASDLYNSSNNLNGYAQQGLQNINHTSDLASKVLQNTLASRGLSYSPYAGNVEAQNELNRTSQASNFLNSLPLLQRQLQQQSLGGLVSAFSALPTDTSNTFSGVSNQQGNSQSTGSSTTHGTTTAPGNMLGGLFSGLGSGLGGGFDILSSLGIKPFGLGG